MIRYKNTFELKWAHAQCGQQLTISDRGLSIKFEFDDSGMVLVWI